jgi:hypothetical protein
MEIGAAGQGSFIPTKSIFGQGGLQCVWINADLYPRDVLRSKCLGSGCLALFASASSILLQFCGVRWSTLGGGTFS